MSSSKAMRSCVGLLVSRVTAITGLSSLASLAMDRICSPISARRCDWGCYRRLSIQSSTAIWISEANRRLQWYFSYHDQLQHWALLLLLHWLCWIEFEAQTRWDDGFGVDNEVKHGTFAIIISNCNNGHFMSRFSGCGLNLKPKLGRMMWLRLITKACCQCQVWKQYKYQKKAARRTRLLLSRPTATMGVSCLFIWLWVEFEAAKTYYQ